MKRISKERREADQLREKIKSILAEPEGWRHYEDQRNWLRKLLREEPDYVFSKNHRDAVNRIAYMRTFFEGWDGLTAQELIQDARQSIANFGIDDEEALIEIEHANRLTRDTMAWLVGVCRAAGLSIRPFDQRAEANEDA
jgi:hypothetical protein